MSEAFANKHASSSLADVADISLADLHNVMNNKEASRVRDLTLDPTATATDSLVCKCCSMSAVENI